MLTPDGQGKTKVLHYMKEYFLNRGYSNLKKENFIRKHFINFYYKNTRKFKIIFNLIYGAEFIYSDPKKKNIIIYDSENMDQLLQVVPNQDYEIIANRIKEIMSKAESNAVGVRVGVKSGGCAGMSYIMEYTKEINSSDEMIEDKGVKLFVDPGAIMYLLGTEMDYKKEEFSSSFVFKNPNETERCGCGESFKI